MFIIYACTSNQSTKTKTHKNQFTFVSAVKALANCFNPVGMAMAAKIFVDPRITLAMQHADNHTDEATAFKATLMWIKMLLPPYPPKIPKRSRYSEVMK